MPLEFPRPTYPGDFVSCNVYTSVGYNAVEFSPDNPGPYSLTLQHDGLVHDMLYEIVFGPFAYSIIGDPGQALLGFQMYHFNADDETMTGGGLIQNYDQTLSRYIVPQVIGYYIPRLTTDSVVITGEFHVDFGFEGAAGTYAVLEYGTGVSPTVFAVRPVDQTNNENFRIIQATTLDLPYIP